MRRLGANCGILGATCHRDRLAAMLPAIAIRAAVRASAIELAEILDFGQFIDEPGGKQEHARSDALSGFEHGGETAIAALYVHHLYFAKLDCFVTSELRTANLQKLAGR